MENYSDELEVFSGMPNEALTEITTEDLLNEIRDPAEGPTTPTPNSEQPAPEGLELPESGEVNLGSLIDEADAGELYDGLMVSLLVIGLKLAGQDADKNALKATSKQKQILGKVLHRCLSTISIDFNNPWNALLFSSAMIYGGKVIGEIDLTKIGGDKGQKRGSMPPEYMENESNPNPAAPKRGRGRPPKKEANS